MSINQDNILTKALEKKISRRSFVKWSAALGATASMSGLVMQTGAKMAVGAVDKPAAGVGGTIVDWKPSCCLVCHSWCHIACGVDANGHIRKIEGAGGQPKTYSNGNPVRPYGGPGNSIPASQSKSDDANHIATGNGFLAFAPHNKGRICAKGNDGVEHLYDPDRIKYPLKRLADRGEGQWMRLSWDDALGEIANVMRELAGLTTDVDGNSINGARGVDNRHRMAVWIGRNEQFSVGQFSKAYGVTNHIEHTSLCELSRHAAGRTMWGHHWSSVDLQEHADGVTIPWPAAPDGPGGTLTLDSNMHDTDCYIEWGGNPCEAKIPHSSWANHLGDRRRRNLQGFSGAPRAGTTYGRIMCIDVRQSNTAAWADEGFQIVPGTDSALALGILYGVMTAKTSTTLRHELDKGHMGGTGGKTGAGADYSARLYYGLFTAEESGGGLPGIGATEVPLGKSLESYLFGLNTPERNFPADIGAAGNTWVQVKTAVATTTGLPEADIQYLTDVFTDGNGGAFLNVVTDGYRGPAKHTNGTYNYRALRMLQVIAPNYSAKQWNTAMPGANAYVGGETPRGGYNAPGGFISDKDWLPYANGGGVTGEANGTAVIAHPQPGLPADQGLGAHNSAPSKNQRIDDWDYDYDVPRYRGSYKWVDQNFSPAIRHSVGLHPFVKGASAPASIKGPYYYDNWVTKGPGVDQNYKVEALLSHKNAPGFSRPQQDNEVELLTAKDANGKYLLANFWSIDIAMGDGTRFADIVLPDVSYLERYSKRSGEGQEFNYRPNTFWRMPVFEINSGPGATVIDGEICPRHLYDSRQISAIHYELARKIENTEAGEGGPWNGDLYKSFKWSTQDTGSVAGNITAGKAYVNDGEWARLQEFKKRMIGGALDTDATAAGAVNGEDLIRSHGMLWNSNDNPAYWRGSYAGNSENAAYGGNPKGDAYAPFLGFKPDSVESKLTIFNSKLDTMPDMVDSSGNNIATFATKADGTLFGTPVWIKPIQLDKQDTVNYPLHLTTYKLNVQTQSRTACLPRLTEILGNSWAVIHPTTAAAYGGIVNGDTVRVSSETGGIEAVAKVSEKAQPGCVHISHSFGHRKGVYSVDNAEGFDYRAAFGEYKVDGSKNRSLDNTLNNPAPSPVTAWSLALPPSAPGKGAHCNKVITHHVDGDTGDGTNIATDPVGGSQAWFDTKVKIEKI